MKITADLDPATRYFKQLDQRFAALGAQLTYQSAMALLHAVAEGQQDGPEGEQMRRALTVAHVIGPGGLTSPKMLPNAFAVFLDVARVPNAKLHKLGPKSVIYVRPRKRRAVRTAKEVEILFRHSPWPIDMLPVFPTKRQATLVYRKVTKEEVGKIREQRIADAPQWRAAFASAGIDTAKPKPPPPKVEVTPDLVFFAARQEFGGGRTKPLRLWRRALKHLVGSGVRSIMRQPHIRKLLGDPAYQGWKKLAKIPTGTKITTHQAHGFKRFQKRMSR